MLAQELIDADADRVVRRLARRGHQAYLVGGCVRDLLLHRTPKDFDVATSATPNEIKHLFRNCRIIGRRFRLAHVFFGGKIIETSTFRANPHHDDDDDELLIRRDNVFGSDTEDARRRDFTINGLFYDVETEQVIDHVGGLADLEARLIRTIGDPEIRFREDPVRMLRAIKFAARLDFGIEPATYAALIQHRHEILKCAPPRVLEELYRMLRSGAARRSVALLIDTGMAGVLSPSLASLLAGPQSVPAPVLACPELVANQLPPASQPSPLPFGSTGEVAPPADPEALAWAAIWAGDQATASEPGRGSLVAPVLEERGFARPTAARFDDDGWEDHRAAVPDDHGDEEFEEEEEEDDDDDDGGEEEENLEGDLEGTLTHDPRTEALEGMSRPPLSESTSIAAHREMAWKVLDHLDELATGDTPLSNALLLAALLHPFVIDDLLLSGNRPVDASTAILVRSQPVVLELRIARRDAERARQILLAQRRLAPSRRRRGRPMALVRRDYFDDSLTVYEIAARAAGRDTSDVDHWRQIRSEGTQDSRAAGEEAETTKKRRRRRGGRRRRRPEAEHPHSAAPARSGAG